MRSNQARPRRAVLALIIGAMSIAGCSETKQGAAAVTTGSLSRPSTATDSTLQFPTTGDLAPLTATAAQARLQQLFVSREAAERFARGFVTLRGYLTAPLSVCLALPREDGAGSPVAWQLILAQEGRCASFAALLQQARLLWDQAQSKGDEPPIMTLKRAIEASAERFYFIEVAAHTFHHPLREGHRGLPSWVFSAARGELPLQDASCTPEAVLPPPQGHHYLVRYRCGKSALVYSHSRRQVLAQEQLVKEPPASETYVHWQQVVRGKYGEKAAGRLEQQRQIWEKYLRADPLAGADAEGRK